MLLLLVILVFSACLTRTIDEAPVLVTDPTEAQLCSAYRDPEYPCVTADGRGLRDGECCVVNGNLGTCFGEDFYGNMLQIPWCNTLR